MKEENLYNIFLRDNNIIYSIDMIRLKTYITYSKFSEIEFMIETSYKEKVSKFWGSNKMNGFKYNYVIEVEEGKSIYFGFLSNNESVKFHNDTSTYNFTIEFNPNKLKDNSLVMFLLGISGDWFLKSYDIALDMQINILDLITDMTGRSFERIDNRGYDNKTIYVGKGDGRLKVYNKKIESSLDIVGDLTRVEVSRIVDDFEIRKVKILNYDGVFPNIYTNNYIYSFSDYNDKMLLAVLFAVQNGYPIRNLTRTYKKKVENLLEGGYKIRFSANAVTNVLRRTIFYYFMPNNKIVWW